MELTRVEIRNLAEAREEIAKIGADPGGVAWMAPKAVFRVIKVKEVPAKAANILKQEMLSKGAEAAVTCGVPSCEVETTDVLMMGTLKQYREVIRKLKMQPWGLKQLAEALENFLSEDE